MATLEELTDRIRRAASSDIALDKTIKLDLKGEGVIVIDGANVSNEDRKTDLVVTISRKDLEALGKRELDPMRAIMTGRMRLSDMGLAMKLQPQIQALFSKAS
ncbi:SCP2 sterol-binding domain-containing protein [Phenylobacterium sp.]|jgi:putative sterol carrier protein|uniref:SCP2 sterol-binding domain-containing protein n=1 Tax=Phenylobacterium sp. TaxID=1871053 RepID=UPI002F924125